MINTEVKKLGDNEYALHVYISKQRYDEVYARYLEQMQYRAISDDNTDDNILEGELGPVYSDRLFEMTVSELIKSHHSEAIEASGLTPALEPAIDVPEEQENGKGLEFVMKCVTWPKLELADLSSIDMVRIDVNVTDEDIQAFIGHLIENEVRFEKSNNRSAKNSDQIVIDYEGFIDGVAFEGGKGENTELILGQKQFIPAFEEGLIGAKTGDELNLEVSFPDNYQAPHLAGKDALFKIRVISVAEGIRASDQHELASILGYDNADELREEAINILVLDAEKAAFDTTKESVIETLLAVHSTSFPDQLIEQEMENSILQMRESMQHQGMPFDKKWLEEKGFADAIRRRSERWLTQALILRTIYESAGLNVSEAELDEELERLAREHPDAEADEFKRWMREDDERISGVVDDLLEKKCILYVLSQASVRQQTLSLAEWKEKQANISRAHDA